MTRKSFFVVMSVVKESKYKQINTSLSRCTKVEAHYYCNVLKTSTERLLFCTQKTAFNVKILEKCFKLCKQIFNFR